MCCGLSFLEQRILDNRQFDSEDRLNSFFLARLCPSHMAPCGTTVGNPCHVCFLLREDRRHSSYGVIKAELGAIAKLDHVCSKNVSIDSISSSVSSRCLLVRSALEYCCAHL